ncbi:maltooligosyl trehalose hydrolase [Devosia lucknowensis]|uniref:Malto-oligosyltrehalose trehalohydrolase n=1 Tax=Devosia lucknowensis TaxID=1096929 RepID=A0A1Y6F2N7_9HYPH|nr:alpha-amylase family glycosyl hydrolase [Devosia lucknowensis]SMQ68746.1 maltooligosyl trehalose hydrolase [Devosia lucknowensis]
MTPLFGPLLDGEFTHFRFWSPGAEAVDVIFPDRESVALVRDADGWWAGRATQCGPGTRYKFRIGALEFPDPASRFQDGDSAGWSIVCAPLVPSGRTQPLRPWSETIICEVHVGTVSPEGTFEGLEKRLEYFRDAGYTALEIMPINDFPGTRNWGYDGTLVFAPDETYGTREALRSLVDRAHELGLCMILDVVYNHFGDVGNFIDKHTPEWFDDSVETPWGTGIDFTQEMVRQFYYENTRMWLDEFDFDGLRFDAVHEMKTEDRDRFLGDLAKVARDAKGHAKLILENMDNCASWLTRDPGDEPVDFTAQWNDDIHHVLHHLVTGEERQGYDDADVDPVADLEKALADGFVHDGEAEGESDGTTRGEPASRLPPEAFVSFVQNHDQIGNRADSKRLASRVDPQRLDFLHFVTIMAPQIPLLFMGEEAQVRSPFPYFFDLPEDAAAPKREDRYRQMREIFEQPVENGTLPDPNAVETFESARLDWAVLDGPTTRPALERFRQLAAWRRQHVWPLLATKCLDAKSSRSGNAIHVRWIFEGGALAMVLNASATADEIGCVMAGEVVTTGSVAQHGARVRLGAWSAVAWSGPN